MARVYPPGPANYLAWIGLTYRHVLLLYHNPIRYFQSLKQRYGDFVFYRLFWHESFLISHPEQVREVLVTKARSFVKQRREMSILRRSIGGDGVVSSEGEVWKRQRRIMLPAFHSVYAQRLAELTAVEARRMTDAWKPGQEILTNQAMTDMLVNAVCQALFGVEARDRAAELGGAMNRLSLDVIAELRSPFRMTAELFGFRNAKKEATLRLLTEFVDETIRRRRAEGTRSADFISLLLDAVDREGDGRGMTNREARTEALTMLFAGHHTAANTLAWTLHLLDRNPAARLRLEQEVDAVLGGRPASPADVPQLEYTTRVIKESMRIYPAAWSLFGREAVEDVHVGKYLIPRGGFVYIAPLLIHRDPRWFPDPLCFDPDRFLPEREEALVPGSYLPFGLGGHSCMGGRAAMLALPLALATIAQRRRLLHVPGQSEPKLEPLISLRPEGDIRMLVAARRPTNRDMPSEFDAAAMRFDCRDQANRLCPFGSASSPSPVAAVRSDGRST